jgi:pimeloyl-ACP methyl ester carboxylesterase
MHPLGLDSSGFEGVGRVLARRGMRTIAVDLPGFGRTPLPKEPLTPGFMAEPVIALARSLPTRPIVLGLSMGGRVALESALTAPDAFAGVIAIAPYLPWLRFRSLVEVGARLIDPQAAYWLPLEHLWPALRWLARTMETLPWLRDDELAQAGARLVYYMSCPATRAGLIGAAREMALDPPYGPQGLWTRMPHLAIPGMFIWGERDQLVSLRFARAVARACPEVPQVLMPCVGHWMNGPHHRCLAEAIAGFVTGIFAGTPHVADTAHASGVSFVTGPCVVLPHAAAPTDALGATRHGA